MVVGIVVVFGAVGTALLVSSSANTPCTKQTFSTSKNSRNTCVGYIQHLTNWHPRVVAGSTTYLTPDSSFGPKTKAAIIELQKFGGLTQDGIVGPNTWALLCSYYHSGSPPASYPLTFARKAGCIL